MDREINPFDWPKEYKMFGAWVSMGQLSEEWFIACLAETAKRLMEQLHKSVIPKGDINLIFKLIPSGEDGTYEVTGAWKCFGESKGGKQNECETSGI